MMIFSLVAMTGLEKCCITSAYLQWLCHSGERPVARGPLVLIDYKPAGTSVTGEYYANVIKQLRVAIKEK